MNIGILGFAHGHVRQYMARWQHEPQHDIQVTAGWDHDAERLASVAVATGLEPHDTVDALLASGVDAVVIAAETSMHAGLVEQAAAAGKAIVLQKPMCLTLAEAARIKTAVEGASVPFTLAWQMRVDPANLAMKKLVDDGTLGDIYMVRRRHGLSCQLMDGIGDSWHVQPELNRGMWADDASHAMDFLLWLLGEPVSVTAEIATLGDGNIPDDHGIAVFRYARGTIAEVTSSFLCLAMENTTEIIGSRGVLVHNHGDGPSTDGGPTPRSPAVRYRVEGGDWVDLALDIPDQHFERIGDLAGPLADFLHGRRGPIATVAEGVASMRMMCGSYASAAAGARVNLAEVAGNERARI